MSKHITAQHSKTQSLAGANQRIVVVCDDTEILRAEAAEACRFWRIAFPPGASYEHLAALIHGIYTGKIEPLKTDTKTRGEA